MGFEVGFLVFLLSFRGMELDSVVTVDSSIPETLAIAPEKVESVFYSPDDKWLGEDKFWHWSVSAILYGASHNFFTQRLGEANSRAALESFGVTLVFGILKEFYDVKSYGLFSFKDLVYDLLGIGTGYLVFSHSF